MSTADVLPRPVLGTPAMTIRWCSGRRAASASGRCGPSEPGPTRSSSAAAPGHRPRRARPVRAALEYLPPPDFQASSRVRGVREDHDGHAGGRRHPRGGRPSGIVTYNDLPLPQPHGWWLPSDHVGWSQIRL